MNTTKQKYINLYVNRGGLRASINAKCIECIYDPEAGVGTWKQQVGACTSPSCPLYTVRAGQRSTKSSKKQDSKERSPVEEGYPTD